MKCSAASGVVVGPTPGGRPVDETGPERSVATDDPAPWGDAQIKSINDINLTI